METSSRAERVLAVVLPIVPAVAVALYWIESALQGEPFSVASIYRHGDYNYFPPLAGLARFSLGESLVFEHLGEGIRSFPFASLALHGVALGTIGPAGFVLADVFVAVCAYFAARSVFRAGGLSGPTTTILSLVVSCGLVGWPRSQVGAWLDWAPLLHLWGFRLPRPFLTDLFLLLCLGAWLRLVVERRDTPREWTLLGLWFGLLLQSRFYSGATLGFAIASTVALIGLHSRSAVAARLRGPALFASTTAVVMIPFAVQRWLEHPDVAVRLGTFPVDRWSPRFLEGVGTDLISVSLFAILGGALVRRSSVTRRRERMESTALLGLLFLLSSLALPSTTILLGRTIQPYQFGDELVTFKTLVVLLVCGQIVDVAATALSSLRPNGERLRSALATAAVLATVAICLVGAARVHAPSLGNPGHARLDFESYRAPGYRAAFRELVRELESGRYAEARVLATLDIQVLDWWSLFGGGQAYCPDPCATILGDDEIEARLLGFLRLLGVSPREMLRIVQDRAVMIFFLACAKYQASAWYQFAPLDDYPGQLRLAILDSSPLDSWQVLLPRSEGRRLLERYERTSAVDENLRLDLIVLGPSARDRALRPPSDRFERTFSNASFRVYRRKSAS